MLCREGFFLALLEIFLVSVKAAECEEKHQVDKKNFDVDFACDWHPAGAALKKAKPG